MKLMYWWEPDDIRPGMLITRQSSPEGSKNVPFMTTVTFKIGYINRDNGDGAIYALISMVDGLIYEKGTKFELINCLNSDDKGFRPISPSDYDRVTAYFKKEFL